MFRQIIHSAFNEKLKNTRIALYVLLGIFAFNTLMYTYTEFLGYPKVQRRKDAIGLSHDKAQHFLYFYYYTDYFPLASKGKYPAYNREAAQNFIEQHPEDLIMEYEHWARLGENARIWAYLPKAWLSGSPENPSVRLFNAICFTLAIMVVFLGFRRAQKPLLGLIIAVLANLSPFLLFENYGNENIFGLMSSGFLFILGLNADWLFRKRVTLFTVFLSAILSAIVIGFFAEIRNEILVVSASVVFIYLLSSARPFLLRIVSLSLFILFLMGTRELIQQYFEKKFEETYTFVQTAGGHPYNGKQIEGHRFWHPVFCGLGDFDFKYGYAWNDPVAYRYAVPVLKEKYGLEIPYSGKLHTDLYYDKDSLYYIKFDEIDHYETVMKDKVLGDISSDPLWFSYIVFMRLLTVLTITHPLPLLGWLALYVIYVLWREQKWAYLKLIIVSMPLSATSVIIYAGGGSTYNSIFPLIAFAIFLFLQVNFDPWLRKIPFIRRFVPKKS